LDIWWGSAALAAKNTLKEYRQKRDFQKTPEPSPGKKKRGKEPIFVIQKHQARTLHYDFRLEAAGVLNSWAVPKGPSLDPREKRLAVPTEDHPLAYRDFEGVIPEGEYGAGTVIVWDTGVYRNLKEKNGKEIPLEQCLEEGHITVWLEGKKIKGGYALIRTGKEKDRRWLLVKMDDQESDARRNPVRTQPESVLSGLTNADMANQNS
jgi:DNA ligase D-like protein (predicted 3'-phosphoesterase)